MRALDELTALDNLRSPSTGPSKNNGVQMGEHPGVGIRSDQSGSGLPPILLSVPDAKGEDDQRQAHHYRENTDEWR